MSTSTQSIREIVTEHPSAASVFHRFDIDLCTQAELSLDRACAQLQLSLDQVLEKLEDAERNELGIPPLDPANLSPERLMQHIVRVYHRYVREELPALAEMAHKLVTKHGNRSPELLQVQKLVESLLAAILAHIQKKEQTIFPFILQMDDNIAHENLRSVEQLIQRLVQEHESVECIVAELRHLTHGFEPPAGACATHCALYSSLRAFETNLRRHVHLENNVLFPEAIQRQSTLSAQS
jgi:regulator of cell morphogenesis and NO signaling